MMGDGLWLLIQITMIKRILRVGCDFLNVLSYLELLVLFVVILSYELGYISIGSLPGEL